MAVVVALHGRGATAQGIVNLLDPVSRHGVTVIAPQAERSRWYPRPADAPHEANEPALTSALDVVDAIVEHAVTAMYVEPEQIIVLGFSQGGCVAAEYAARTAASGGDRKPPAVVVLSGSLLGPSIEPERYDGTLDGASVFVGCGADDTRVPTERVRDTAAVFRSLDGDVTERIYDGVGHEVTDDEFEYVDGMLAALVEDG